jgi:hypothetical protein
MVRHFLRPLVAIAFATWTWVWFLPIGGFHHMFRCGLLGWAILDWENPEFEMRWSASILAMSVSVWALGLFGGRAAWPSSTAKGSL